MNIEKKYASRINQHISASVIIPLDLSFVTLSTQSLCLSLSLSICLNHFLCSSQHKPNQKTHWCFCTISPILVLYFSSSSSCSPTIFLVLQLKKNLGDVWLCSSVETSPQVSPSRVGVVPSFVVIYCWSLITALTTRHLDDNI